MLCIGAASDGTVVAICGYAVPSRPGHSRFITTSYLVTNSGAARAALALAPKPLLHAMLNEVLDGDLLLVAAQERNLRKVCGTLRLLSLLCPAEDLLWCRCANAAPRTRCQLSGRGQLPLGAGIYHPS